MAMRLMQNFEDRGKLYYEPVRLSSILKRITAFVRIKVWGFCPMCNSDAPELYDCPVCVYDTNSPFKKTVRKHYWNQWKLIDFKMHNGTYIYIPCDLDDCFKQLNKRWSDEDRTTVLEMTESNYLATVHHGPGQWIRNNWGLWAGSRLAKYFNRIGIDHPDDMSGIILTSYYRKLTCQDLRLDEQIKEYQDYWKRMKADKVVKIKVSERVIKKAKRK